MRTKEKIEVIKEINRSEEEARKYDLGAGYHAFFEVLDQPEMFWMGTDPLTSVWTAKRTKKIRRD